MIQIPTGNLSREEADKLALDILFGEGDHEMILEMEDHGYVEVGMEPDGSAFIDMTSKAMEEAESLPALEA